MWKRLIWWWKIIKQYLCNCNIHGVRYLVDDQFSYIERFFWLIFCVLCWVGCGNMIKGVIDYYIEYPVAVTTETMYVDWQTPFPAIAICITSNKVMRNKYFKLNAGSFPPNAGSTADVTGEELLTAYEELKVPCENFMQNCMWNNKKFNCCEEFQVLKKTGVGHCIAFNSFHIVKNGKSGVNYFVNRTVKYGDLIIDVVFNKATKNSYLKGVQIYLLDNINLPLISTNQEYSQTTLKGDHMTRIEFLTHSTFNEEGVKNVDIERRNCRFQNEVLKNSLFDIYSMDSCNLEIMIRGMIESCGCVHFYYITPPDGHVCNRSQMQCLYEKKAEFLSPLDKVQKCLPDCEETLLLTNFYEPVMQGSPGPDLARIHVTMLSHPTLRHRRYVINDILNVIVSVGSAVGLFMGVSILSIFEIPYWLFIRRDRIS